MDFPRLEDLESIDGSSTLVRLDLNVPLLDGQVQDATRVEAALPTLRWLLERGAKVGVCSHLGKPKGRPDPALSLAPVAPVLAELLGAEVRFVGECVGADVAEAVVGAGQDSVVLLENLRFHAGEKADDLEFARTLVAPFTHYVNDAFGTAHRAHASVAGIPGIMAPGHKAAGRLMEAELDALTSLMDSGERPFVAVVGGAKISTKTAPLEALLERVDALAIGGGMANTFMLARGLEIGRSLVEVEMLTTARKVLDRAAERRVDFMMPEDVVVADAIDAPSKVEVVAADSVPADALIVDIGPITRARYTAALTSARRVFWNGPMGVFEVEAFAEGTMDVARAMAASEGFTVIGGGESVMAVHRAGVAGSIGHVSTGGGASLALIAGEALPAIVALEG